ncbi:hypothetical protein Smp_162860 [Schistosoma mansoni]|uniref:hypothetical protein n=1 Tax=Schistosoma mansoni TaxID=6183 RepID=UPI0001A62BEC|nr:hypothetical protein Smp_162860 [Schistosoma mansoni]|eukprot:XP_018645806.1 hypothetical protein Smp_162860 [Schistosoma mansoni]
MFTKKDWLPKRICVPRKSVSIDDSSSWVYSFGPTNSLRPRRSFRRVAPDSGIVINTKNQEDEGCINISPTSSPEGETLEFGHQLLSIENLDEPISSNEFQQLQNLISGNCSSSVSSQNENAVIYSTKHTSKTFQILRVFRNYSDNLPGLVAFGVREVVTHLENETETFDVNENVSNKFAILLLPISGVPFGAEELFSSTATNFVLGNDLKCGDFVMIFSPWSTYPSHEFNSLPVLHSFFWVERLKHEVLSDVENDFPDPQITPHKLELITCSCLNSCDPFVVLNCSKRFKGSAEPKSSVIQTFQDSSEKMLTEIFNRNCFLVLGCYRFWLLKKLRHILLVWHYNNGPGLILLPDQLTHSGNLNNPISYQDFHIGNVYTSESLLQLPDNQLQANVQKEIHDHLNEIKDSLESKYASNLNNFIHGSTIHHNPITEKTCIEYSNYSIKLWDARVSRFNLVESNYIHFNLSTPYKPAEGSLVKDIILDWYHHESRRLKCCSLKNLNIFTDEQKSTRIFYLWISDSVTSTTLIPCICLVDVISPMELIYEHLFAISSTSNFLSTTGFGVYIMIDQGLFFDSTLIRVDTSRSHVWPICPYCSCADFEIYSDNNDKIKYFSKQENLKCVRCLSILSNPLQRLELEVQVLINFDDDQSTVNKLKRHKSSVELTLNMASWRLCKLLNVTPSNLLKESGLNAQELVNRHLDNVIGIVVHIPNKVFPVDNVQNCNDYLRNIYVIELDQMKNGN